MAGFYYGSGSSFGSQTPTYGLGTRPPRTPGAPGGGYLQPSPLAQPIRPPIMSMPGAPSYTNPNPGGGPQAPAGPDLSHIDFSNDPILARVRALAEESMRAAEADALSQRTRLAIGFGDPELAKQLKLGGKIADQAANNPFGTRQEIGRGFQRRNVFDINSPLSDRANLFYSTERGRQLGLSGEQKLRDEAQAVAAIQAQLAQISQGVVQTKMQTQFQILQAEQAAYQNALQQALYASGAN